MHLLLWMKRLPQEGTQWQHMILAVQLGPASKAGHECLIEITSLEARSYGVFMELGEMAMAMLADDVALAKLEAS